MLVKFIVCVVAGLGAGIGTGPVSYTHLAQPHHWGHPFRPGALRRHHGRGHRGFSGHPRPSPPSVRRRCRRAGRGYLRPTPHCPLLRMRRGVGDPLCRPPGPGGGQFQLGGFPAAPACAPFPAGPAAGRAPALSGAVSYTHLAAHGREVLFRAGVHKGEGLTHCLLYTSPPSLWGSSPPGSPR